MANQVRHHGGLLCPKCYHNPDCSFDGKHPSGASYYAGANIVYRARYADGQQHALAVKWSNDPVPGPRGAVCGACYVFLRSWYYAVGQPLSALPGWGCDEEALSIAAWLSGFQPTVFDGRVAHRWRDKTPWTLSKAETLNVHRSRASLIHAVVPSAKEQAALMDWQGINLSAKGKAACTHSEESERFRAALLEQRASMPNGGPRFVCPI
jgi:hypothetical protein